MIMPASAIKPSNATKPNGYWPESEPSAAPMMPRGAVRNDQNQPRKTLQLDHQQRRASPTIISGNSREDRRVGLGTFLDRAADLDAVAR